MDNEYEVRLPLDEGTFIITHDEIGVIAKIRVKELASGKRRVRITAADGSATMIA